MKKLLYLFLFCSLLSSCKSHDVMWKGLTNGAQNSSSLFFHNVQFTDSATIVDFDVQGRGYKLQKKTKLITDNGTELGFLKLEGGPLQKEIPGPGRFQMYFEPAPKGCKWIHFYEGKSNNDWRVSYIREKKTQVKVAVSDEWKKVKYDLQETLPVASYNPDTVAIDIQCIGYEPWMNVVISYYGTLFGEQERTEGSVKLDSAGKATINVPVKVLGRLTLYGGIDNMDLVINPGDRISCLIDMTNAEKGVDFKGAHATLHHEMTSKAYKQLYTKICRNYEPFAKVADCETEEERVRALNEGLETAKMLIAKSKLSDATQKELRLQAENTYWNVVIGYPIFLRTLRNLKFENAEEHKEFYKKYRKAFSDSLKMVLAASQPFDVFLAPYAPILGRDFYNGKSYFLRGKAEFLPYNKDLFYANAFIQQGMPSDSVSSISFQDSTLIKAIDQNYAVQKASEEALRQDDAVYYHQLDSIAPEEILQYIIDKYKGQAFLIDMWATWCGPCRSGHKMMAPLKEELKNEPVKFVYITNETSPASSWKKMIDEIPGDHYYLTNAQQQAIMKFFESSGIPTYAIYDAEGNQTYKKIGFPGNKEMKRQLLKAMKKE